MANRPVAIRRALPGALAAACVAAFVASALGAVLWFAGGGGWPDAADWAALRFTVMQAGLSAVFSVTLAIPVARALARRSFPLRGALIVLLGAPFILPVIVAVMGLLTVFGRSGIVSDFLALLGLPKLSIYGLHGVLLAHVFLNLPLATRILLQGWQDIPAERFRLAATLGMGPAQIQRFLEWPMLRATAPAALLAVFGMCLNSFAVVLMLGGGPKSTTLELAIYQAFRFDFDLGRAATLAAIQALLVGGVVWIALRFTRLDGQGAGMDRPRHIWGAGSRWLRLQDTLLIVLAALFLLVPLGAVVLRGVVGLADVPPSVWGAFGASVSVALVSTVLAVVVSLWVAIAALRWGWTEVLATLGLSVSPLVLGTGLFLMVNPWINPARLAFAVTALVNAVMLIPFALRVIAPALRAIEADYGRQADILGLTGWARMRLLILPRARRGLGFAAGLAAAMSMGDLGVIALFADPHQATLPLQMYRLMGAYRMEAAAGAALILLGGSLALFWIFDRWGRGDAKA
ncbi:thiamine transport system permease protein [Thalassovita litoralis]|uniref:Thiamine transport system permease protein n=1 Tax=Thalassovita litoralis TaxID=1010611 RepID=A0A521AQT1_9RHOB|nr:thiamine/thiamine pyrophosphate ABC transporter permease ThiP [Thalassovita litoralis]SMO37167.1 thiamine transport system permease protein [Thalassovita litoralis]